ncbi:hypothetical protein RUM43_009837 [Polyplax serrata]|uniref:Glycoprotein hormone subunit beta domain-containing protein n=1 Tax=Polyplax serrata TaxID=468196 RepID=A0AAN8P364_POLSC
MPPLVYFTGLFLTTLLLINVSQSQSAVETDLDTTLDCNRRTYSHKVIQTDSEGKICWDMVTVVSCWGRCDSNEVSDWKFPYKRSHHPVCMHGEREPKTVVLSNCEEGVEPGTEIHEFMEAVSCQCSLCKSSEANCQGVRYNGEGEIYSFQRA